MTEQDLIHKIEWVNKRCSLKGEPLTQSQIELLKFVFADNVVNENFALADVSGECLHPYNSVRTDKITELSRCSICEKEWY